MYVAVGAQPTSAKQGILPFANGEHRKDVGGVSRDRTSSEPAGPFPHGLGQATACREYDEEYVTGRRFVRLDSAVATLSGPSGRERSVRGPSRRRR